MGVGDPHLLNFLGDVAPLDAADDTVAGVQGIPPGSVRRRGQRGRGMGVEAPGVATLLLQGLLDAPLVGLPQGLDPIDLSSVLQHLLSEKYVLGKIS